VDAIARSQIAGRPGVPRPSAAVLRRPGRFALRLATVETFLLAFSLFLLSGGIFVLLMSTPDGGVPAENRKFLQLLNLPVYLSALLVLARRPQTLMLAIRRNLPFALLLALPFLSVLWSVSPGITLKRAIGFALSMLFAYALAIRFTPRQLLVLVALVMGGMMVLSLAMIASPHLAFMPETGELRGIFNHKNLLGWNAALALIVSTALAVDRHAGLQMLGLGLAAASAVCLVLSESATSLGVVVCAVPLGLFYRNLAVADGLGRLLLIVIAFLSTMALLLSFDLIIAPLLESAGKDATLTGRVPLWHLVDERIAERLPLGYGYQSFWTEGNGDAWVIWSKIGWMAPHAHNGYRETLLNFGVMGALVMAFVVFRAIRQGATLHCSQPEAGWAWLNVLVGAFLIMNLTESLMLAQNSLLFTLFAAAIISFSLRRPR
jgi:exopolysaccharide production protein ExoQ